MAITPINSEDRLVQATFAEHLRDKLGWISVYAFNDETFGPGGTLGRKDTTEAVLTRDLREALVRLNPDLPPPAIDNALRALTAHDFSLSMVQHNQNFARLIRNGVPVQYRDTTGRLRNVRARMIDFENKPGANRFLAVRELKLTGLRTPNYNRRADVVCFINGLPLVFIELKAVYKNIRAGFDSNLRDYMDENVIAHAFHHNAFLIVSNGDRARYGSITSEWEHFAEWKRLDESDKGKVDAQILLDGMLAHGRLLDIIENFILFDESKPGATRKVVARNHQVLGVNRAVASVLRQEDLKREFPVEKRLHHRIIELPLERRAIADTKRSSTAGPAEAALPSFIPEGPVNIIERAHPDLGRLGVFWHTQGSGKSYSMAFFAEKVRRKVPGNFTFLLMTDRTDLDDQIYKTFAGCGIADSETPRAAAGVELERLLKENHPYVFSLIHKFNQDVNPKKPYSERDDIIVISDEAHRTQSGRLARNMRLALPNAGFIGFTGTPLFKQDEITKRIFGDYVSRYDFKRSEEDGATVKLVYENRGEKLGVARLDLNSRIAEKIEEAELDPDQAALLDKLLGKDYEVITADARLDKIAMDFVEHCATRWESGKVLLVCIDKITCARMHQRITLLWRAKATKVRAASEAKRAEAAATADAARAALLEEAAKLRAQADWLDETIIEIIVSEAQNEVADFKKWGFDIIPHRVLMKKGFDTPDGERVDVETAFKKPTHPFRVAIVCAMWLTGFDVECLSTLYVDKPMKAHTLMQAIARANRVYPGKDFGLIVDYNGMLASLRAALAQYALGDDGTGGEEIVAPIEERVQALIEAIEATEAHLRSLGFDPTSLLGEKGFARIKGLADAVNAVYSTDEAKRRFEILARQVFIRFKALLMEPSAFAYAERHDNLEAIYKKLTERRDTSDVTELLRELHRIVNEAIATRTVGGDQAEGLTFDLSQIDLERLRDEFAKKVTRKATAIQDIRDILERKLAEMLARNPMRMDYQRKYEEIVADYNREKDRTTIEETFRRLVELVKSLDEEQKRAAKEGLREDELALFDLLQKDDLDRTSRERLKQASRELLASIKARLAELDRFWEKEQTKADVEVFILDKVFTSLPTPPFTPEEKTLVAENVYAHIWQQAMSGEFARAA
jgi:type I restriction enzyme R subunit